MHARVVNYTLNPERWDEAVAALDTVVERLATFPGLRSWVNVANRETGKGTAIAAYETEETLAASAPQVQEILAGFGQYMTSAPSVETGDVVGHIDNH